MKEDLKIGLLQKLITEKDISKELRKRKNPYIFESIPINSPELLKEKYNEGWELDREYKTKTKIKKLKSQDAYFEDRVWTLFAKMGFNLLNKDRNFHLPYDKNNDKLTQQIDVFAKDDETVLLIECKSAIENKKGDFKKELEAMSGKIEGLMKTIKALFPDQKLKFKYILATQNYALSKPDIDRLQNLNGVHFDEETIDYYTNLFQQLGLASRYQLLGSLFFGQDIPELDNLVPAIKGKMGGHTYFSFSIEPEKLLKIGYVLHRNKANINMMPTYQRLIKKNRLKQIHTFIDEKKGYFPNSIIISIDTGKKGRLNFDRADTQVKSTISDLGILHLPKKYRSVYIIDGQHRLYGYANSIYKSTNTIPVVAFVDLDRSEQVRLFMDINENQKAVSKNLRLTLNADLLWTSESYLDQFKALSSRIAIFLGESRLSPLFNKISIGEDKKIITSEAIVNALKKSNFLGKVSKNKIEKLGTFYKGDLDTSYENLSKYLMISFDYLKENLKEEWESEDSILIINKGIFAIIKLLSDIVDFLLIDNRIKEGSRPNQIFEETKNYLDPIINFYKNITSEKRIELKTSYGIGGDTKYWRTLQNAVRNTHKEFIPIGLDEFLLKEKKEYNTEAFEIIREIETFFNNDFKIRLENKFEDEWFDKGVPPKIQDNAVVMAQQKKRETGKKIEPWDCLHVIDYREIALKNWRDLFEKDYTRPNEKKISGGKEAKTKWIVELNRLRNQNFHSYYVTKDEIEFLRDLASWLLKKE
jgi:DNA sulfur modification protein DndB